MWYHLTYNGQLSSIRNYSKNLFNLDLLDILHKLCLLGLHYRRWTWIGKGLCLPFHRAWRVGNELLYLCFTLLSKDGTHGAKDLQWKRVKDRGKTWPTYDAQEGVFSFFFTFFIQLLFPDSGKTPWRGGVPLRWTLMEWWFRWVFFYFFLDALASLRPIIKSEWLAFSRLLQ